jgi:hypothetical protein
LHALNDDRGVRAAFVENLIKAIHGRFLPEVDGYRLTTIVFGKVTEELQVAVAVRAFAADAIDHLQRAVDSGTLEFRADFEKIETPGVDWGGATIERRLIGLSGWDGRAVVLYIRPNDELDRLRIDIH